MPPIKDTELASRFWLTTDFDQVRKTYDAARLENAEGVIVPEPQGVDRRGEASLQVAPSDKGLTLLSEDSGSVRYSEVLGRARAFGERVADPNGLENTLQPLGLGGSLDRLAKDLAVMNLRQQKDKHGKPILRGANEQEIKDAKVVLATLLRSDTFQARAVRNVPLSKAGVLSLLNAGLGCLKLIRDGKATSESLIELVRGEVYDIKNPADVLKLSVKTAQKAREIFVNEAQVREFVQRGLDVVATLQVPEAMRNTMSQHLRELGDEIIAERKRLSKSLDLSCDLGDGTKKTLEGQIKNAREAMRAFRYDLDCMNETKMGLMEGLRRKLDNVGRTIPKLTRESFANLHDLERRFNRIFLGEDLGINPNDRPKLVFSDSPELCRRVTDLTHMANNRIRYYFSGKEQKLEAFSQKAHALLDDLVAKGGSRQLQFEIGGDAKFDTGVIGAKATAGAKYLQTATVSVAPGGGEVTVTYAHGGMIHAQATAKFGLNGGEDPGEWSETDRNRNGVLGAEASVQANAHLTRTRTIKYRSVDDFIASLGGESGLISRCDWKTVACCGKICSFFRSVGRGIKNLATWLGFRIPKSREDNAVYVASMHKLGLLGTLDQLVAHRENAVRTQNGTYWTAGGQVGGEASLNVGRFEGTEPDKETGDEQAVKTNFFEGGVALKGSYDGTFARTATDYRPLIESARSHTSSWLDALHGTWYEQLEVPEGSTRAHAALRAIEKEMQELEDAVAQAGQTHEGDEDPWLVFARGWGRLATQLAYVERMNPDLQTRGIADRLVNPHVTVPDDRYDELLQEVATVARSGSHKVTTSFTLSWNVGGGFVEHLGDDWTQKGADAIKLDTSTNWGGMAQSEASKVGAGLVNEGVGAYLPTNCQLKGSYTYTKPVVQTDICAWRNAATHEISFGLTPGLTTRALIEGLARKYVDSFGDIPDDERPKLLTQAKDDLKGALAETLGIGTAETVFDASLTELAKVTPKLASLLKAPITGADTGLELGVTTDYAKSMNFTIIGGRLTAITVDETTSVGGMIGARVGINGVSVGLHMKETLTTREVDRVAFPRPSFDSLMARAEPFLRMGDSEGLKMLLTRNAPAALRLLRVLRAEPGDDPEDAYATGDLQTFRHRQTEIDRMLDHVLEHGTADQQDRATQLRLRIGLANAALDNPVEETDAALLDTLQEVLSAYTDAFVYLGGTGLFSRNASTGELNAFRL